MLTLEARRQRASCAVHRSLLSAAATKSSLLGLVVAAAHDKIMSVFHIYAHS